MLGRYLSNPGYAHWKALKRVLVYLNSTQDRCLVIGRRDGDEKAPLVEMWVDADHGGCKDSGKSTSGGIIKVMGTSIKSYSKRQGACNNSTAGAELYALADMIRKEVVLRILLGEIGFTVPATPITVSYTHLTLPTSAIV